MPTVEISELIAANARKSIRHSERSEESLRHSAIKELERVSELFDV
jgi:hypothetical protein